MSGFRSDSHTSACAAFPVTLVLKFCMVFKGISNVLLWSCPYEVWKVILNELALQQVCCFCNGVLMPLCAKVLGSWAMWLTSVKLRTSCFEIPIRNHHLVSMVSFSLLQSVLNQICVLFNLIFKHKPLQDLICCYEVMNSYDPLWWEVCLRKKWAVSEICLQVKASSSTDSNHNFVSSS